MITAEELEPGSTPRPEPPPRSGRLVVPMLAIAVVTGVLGLLAGEIGALWGALAGAATAAILRVADVSRDRRDVAVLVVAGAAGLAWFDWALGRRTGEIDVAVSAVAAVGWLVFGAGVGYVLWRSGGDRRPTMIGVSAAAWWGGALAAVLWATTIGFLDELRRSAIEAGEVQALGGDFYAYVGVFVALVGAAAGLSLYIGKPSLVAFAAVVAFTVFSASNIDFSLQRVFSELDRLSVLAEDFWPPQWTWPSLAGQPAELQMLEPMIETLQIAIVGATFGCAIALPIAFLASRITTVNDAVFWANRTFMNVIRTIPDLFWAMLFTASVGFGTPFAGALAMIMFSIGIMAKLLSETVDAIDPGPLEATRASGAKHVQMVHYSAMPQVLPNYVAYALYIFELNIRASVVIGIVGAGGIGRLLDEQRNFFQWDRVMAIVIVIFVSVVLIEMVSVTFRRRLV